MLLETGLCAACAAYFGGGRRLLAAAALLNVTSVPMMFAGPGAVRAIAAKRATLPAIILAHTALSVTALRLLAGSRAQELAAADASRSGGRG